jgi:hypothetical protein
MQGIDFEELLTHEQLHEMYKYIGHTVTETIMLMTKALEDEESTFETRVNLALTFAVSGSNVVNEYLMELITPNKKEVLN